MSKKRTLILNLFILVSIGLVFWVSLDIKKDKVYLLLEAESAENICDGLSIIPDQNSSGGKAVVSLLKSHQIEAYASYDLEIQRTGEYQFWARCYWPGGCSNNYLVQIGDSRKLSLGQDPVIDSWHWVKGPSFLLTPGKHELKIWNDEYGARIDKILLALDPAFIPSGMGEKIGSFFYDFEKPDLPKFEYQHPELWTVSTDPALADTALLFKLTDLKNPASLIFKFKYAHVLFPQYDIDTGNLLSTRTNNFINEYNFESPPAIELQKSILDDFNKSLSRQLLSPDKVEEGWVNLKSEKIRQLVQQHPVGEKLERLNRLVLQEIFLNEFEQSRAENQACYLSPLENHQKEYFLKNVAATQDFLFRSQVKFGIRNTKPKNIFLLFNFQDSLNYYSIDLEQDEIFLKCMEKGCEQLLARTSYYTNSTKSEFADIAIIRRFPEISIKYNGKTCLNISDSTFCDGWIGVGSTSGDVWLDNLEFNTLLKPAYENNFFEHDFYRHQSWKPVTGFWYGGFFGVMSLNGLKTGNEPALAVIGENYWQNYSTTVAIKSGVTGEFGVCVCYQDENNYYLIKATQPEHESITDGHISLVKVVEGRETVLAESQICLIPENWYKFDVKLLDGDIRVYLDDAAVFQLHDTSLADGKPGFWTNSAETVSFDCIQVSPTRSFEMETSNSYSYKFELREQAALDLCDWISIPRNVIGRTRKNDWELQTFFKKRMLEDVIAIHKKAESGNLKIDLSINSTIPPDICTNIIFFSSNRRDPLDYILQIKSTKILVFKNDIKVLEKKLDLEWTKLSAEFLNQRLRLMLDGRRLVNYPISEPARKMRVGYGFTGVGETDIRITKIEIETINQNQPQANQTL